VWEEDAVERGGVAVVGCVDVAGGAYRSLIPRRSEISWMVRTILFGYWGVLMHISERMFVICS
jgi:LytS/YehU family sensor histidine kinase